MISSIELTNVYELFQEKKELQNTVQLLGRMLCSIKKNSIEEKLFRLRNPFDFYQIENNLSQSEEIIKQLFIQTLGLSQDDQVFQNEYCSSLINLLARCANQRIDQDFTVTHRVVVPTKEGQKFEEIEEIFLTMLYYLRKGKLMDHQSPLKNHSIKQLWQHLSNATDDLLIEYAISSYPENVNDPFCKFENIRCPRQSIYAVGDKFLHANQIVHENHAKTLVASQAPIVAFEKEYYWKAFFEKEFFVVDLTTSEDRINYYPKSEGQEITFGNIKVKYISKRVVDHDQSLLAFQVTLEGKQKIINRLHYHGWIDFSAITVEKLEKLVVLLNEYPSIWVHCHAGVGRTGTLITTYYLDSLIREGVINVFNYNEELVKLLLKLRVQRGTLFVSNLDQFKLIYEYGLKLVKANVASKP